MKVLGVGLNKTGTTTLGLCFEHWGLSHIACNKEAFELWRKKKYKALLQWIDEYDSFEDWPCPLIYKEIDKAFLDTKFILTRRKDAETMVQKPVQTCETNRPYRFSEIHIWL